MGWIPTHICLLRMPQRKAERVIIAWEFWTNSLADLSRDDTWMLYTTLSFTLNFDFWLSHCKQGLSYVHLPAWNAWVIIYKQKNCKIHCFSRSHCVQGPPIQTTKYWLACLCHHVWVILHGSLLCHSKCHRCRGPNFLLTPFVSSTARNATSPLSISQKSSPYLGGTRQAYEAYIACSGWFSPGCFGISYVEAFYPACAHGFRSWFVLRLSSCSL